MTYLNHKGNAAKVLKVVILIVSAFLFSSFSFSQELLTNSSFDSQDGWLNCGDASAYTIGSGALNITGTACIYQSVPATEGASYTLTCNPSSMTAYSTIALSMLNSASGIILQDVTLVDSPVTRPEVSSLVAPPGTAFIAATIYSEGEATHESCSLVASGLTNPATANTVLINPEFDTQEGWVNCGNANDFGISGGQLNMFGSACVFQTLSASAGMSYTLSCNSNSTAPYSTISLSALSGGFGKILQDIELVNNPDTQFKQAFLTAPAGTEFISVTLYSEGNSTHQFCYLSF